MSNEPNLQGAQWQASCFQGRGYEELGPNEALASKPNFPGGGKDLGAIDVV